LKNDYPQAYKSARFYEFIKLFLFLELVFLLKSILLTPNTPYSNRVNNKEFMRPANTWNSDHVALYSENADVSGPEDSRLIITKEYSLRDRPVNKLSAFFLRALHRTEPAEQLN